MDYAKSMSVFQFPYPGSAPNLWVWICPEHLESNSTAYVLALDAYVGRCINGFSLHSPTVSVVPLNRPLTLSFRSVSHIRHPRNICSNCLGRRNKMLALYPRNQHLIQAVWWPKALNLSKLLYKSCPPNHTKNKTIDYFMK